MSLFVLFWNSSSISILRIKISDDWFGAVKSAEFKFDIARKVRQEKRIFTLEFQIKGEGGINGEAVEFR